MIKTVIKTEPVSAGEHRGLDPNVAQRYAADPSSSVWVGASAGTGKTKVLVDRVLRLLLPRAEGQPATKPHRILCLTFTKAGASEMALRINKTLSEWAVMDEDDKVQNPVKNQDKGLKTRLRELTGKDPSTSDIRAARRLFAEVVDTPGGLKIMTIHAFCQSVLGRFPLEAGLSPHFTVIDEAPAQELLAQARSKVIARARDDHQTIEHIALQQLAAEMNEGQFMDVLKNICSERLQLRSVLSASALGDDAMAPDDLYLFLYRALCQLQGLSNNVANSDYNDMLQAACGRDGHGWELVRMLATGGKTDQDMAQKLQRWLEMDVTSRFQNFSLYRSVFLTTSETVRKLPCKTVKEAYPHSEDMFRQEAQYLLELEENIKAMRCASFTAYLLLFGSQILQEYQYLKEAQAALDYDDLIAYTKQLLDNSDSAWVMYKLDEGLDHILIDEAQDTNPEQWQIIKALVDDFFTGQGQREELAPTIFTVGDEKQSIYSFQRAAPAEFDRMRNYFADKVTKARQNWNPQTLNISFRSTQSVLQLVDAVFDDPQTWQGLGQEKVSHHSFRTGEEGLVELWPLFETADKAPDIPWDPPLTIQETVSSQAQLADFIADKIKGWLDNGEILKSKNRPMRPGDIMILVRTRTVLVSRIVRALKKKNVPVSGADRMVLGEQLAIQDLRALAAFSLCPSDDLTLACVLKTPLIGWGDDKLYNVAIDRQGSLWEAVQQSGDERVVRYLKIMIAEGQIDHPYEFFSKILQRPCPADDKSGLRAIRSRLGDDALDPLDEFQNATLSFERDHLPTLQGFLVWQEQNDITIKRELEEDSDCVKVMTVHGSKGLQAPVVIMPDMTRSSSAKRTPRLLWPDKSGLDLPLWSPKAQYDAQSYIEARANVERQLDEEYRRLLYVALTRAEDRLYLGGYQTRKKPIDESWYYHVEKAFARLPEAETIPFGDDDRPALRLINYQTKPAEERIQTDIVQKHEKARPAWLDLAAAEEPFPPRPLMPSRPSEPEPSMCSPLDRENNYRFRRGNLTHKLLQTLPDIAPDKRHKAAEVFIRQKGHDLPEKVQSNIVAETMKILHHSDYGLLFSDQSVAEVPVTGLLDHKRLVSGQIDRLVVTENEVLIVDYKTNRPPPKDPAQIPAIYKTQMKSYSDIVEKIYPDKKIRCFLLWTDGPNMMEL